MRMRNLHVEKWGEGHAGSMHVPKWKRDLLLHLKMEAMKQKSSPKAKAVRNKIREQLKKMAKYWGNEREK